MCQEQGARLGAWGDLFDVEPWKLKAKDELARGRGVLYIEVLYPL